MLIESINKAAELIMGLDYYADIENHVKRIAGAVPFLVTFAAIADQATLIKSFPNQPCTCTTCGNVHTVTMINMEATTAISKDKRLSAMLEKRGLSAVVLTRPLGKAKRSGQSDGERVSGYASCAFIGRTMMLQNHKGLDGIRLQVHVEANDRGIPTWYATGSVKGRRVKVDADSPSVLARLGVNAVRDALGKPAVAYASGGGFDGGKWIWTIGDNATPIKNLPASETRVHLPDCRCKG